MPQTLISIKNIFIKSIQSHLLNPLYECAKPFCLTLCIYSPTCASKSDKQGTRNFPGFKRFWVVSATTDKDRGAKGTEGLLTSQQLLMFQTQKTCFALELQMRVWNGTPNATHEQDGRKWCQFLRNHQQFYPPHLQVWYRKIFTALVVFDSSSSALVNLKIQIHNFFFSL